MKHKRFSDEQVIGVLKLTPSARTRPRLSEPRWRS